MAKVFISHSSQDVELVSNVASMLKNIGDEPLIMEYAPKGDETAPPYARIREYMRAADHVMLFKTDNAIRTDYTRNWIIFEVGLAAELNKRLFVLEGKGPPIEFPIPYLTDYMVLEPDRVADILRLQTVAKTVSDEDSEGGADASAFGLLFLFVPPWPLSSHLLRPFMVQYTVQSTSNATDATRITDTTLELLSPSSARYA